MLAAVKEQCIRVALWDHWPKLDWRTPRNPQLPRYGYRLVHNSAAFAAFSASSAQLIRSLISSTSLIPIKLRQLHELINIFICGRKAPKRRIKTPIPS
jgi:hypothetical protein